MVFIVFLKHVGVDFPWIETKLHSIRHEASVLKGEQTNPKILEKQKKPSSWSSQIMKILIRGQSGVGVSMLSSWLSLSNFYMLPNKCVWVVFLFFFWGGVHVNSILRKIFAARKAPPPHADATCLALRERTSRTCKRWNQTSEYL